MMTAKRLSTGWSRTGTTCFGVAAAWLVILAGQSAFAQSNYLITGGEPPGMASQKMILSQPALAGYPQPVELIAPGNARLRVAQGGQFGEAYEGKIRVRLPIGALYRFELSQLPEELNLPEGTRLYPTIELLNRIYPPLDQVDQFPVSIVLNRDDLQLAADGKLVTKVIYLEDPETALPIRHPEGDQPTVDVLASEDPLRVAERLGKPMAIVRVGSRVPTATDLAAESDYRFPPLEIITDEDRQEPARDLDPTTYQVPPRRIEPARFQRIRSPRGDGGNDGTDH